MCYNPFTSRSAESQEKTKTTTKTVKQKKQNKNKIKQLHSVKKLKTHTKQCSTKCLTLGDKSTAQEVSLTVFHTQKNMKKRTEK